MTKCKHLEFLRVEVALVTVDTVGMSNYCSHLKYPRPEETQVTVDIVGMSN